MAKRKTLAERLSDEGVYPSLQKGKVTLWCEMRINDEGKPDPEADECEVDITSTWKKTAKLYMADHPEGADRGGHVTVVETKRELAYYMENDGWNKARKGDF